MTVICRTPELGISRAAYYFPSETYTIEQWAQLLNQPSSLVEKLHAGGMRHYHVAEKESPIELAWQAAIRCCTGIDSKSIDLLIVASSVGCSRPPAPLMVHEELRRRLEMRSSSQAFSFVDMHCASLMGAMQLTQRLFALHADWKRALLVSVDKIYEEFSRNIGHHAIQSDGAAALLIEREFSLKRCDAVAIRIEPKYAEGFLKPPELQQHFMASYHAVAYDVLSSTLENLGWRFEDVDAFMFPNMNPSPYSALIERAGIHKEKIFSKTDNVSRHGYANCSDFIVNFADWLGMREPGEKRIVGYASGTTGFFSAVALTVYEDVIGVESSLVSAQE